MSQDDQAQPLRAAVYAKYPNHKHVFVPLLNLSPDAVEGGRMDLELRQDASFLLARLNIDPAQLAFAKGCGPLSCAGDLRRLHDADALRLVLVDHNEFTGVCARVERGRRLRVP